MTAMNIFVRPEAAYIVTDGAHYDLDGVVHQIESKVALSAELSMAFACSGRVNVTRLIEALDRRGIYSQDLALAVLPSAMREIREHNRSTMPHLEAEDGANDIQVFVAMYSADRGRAEAYYCSSNQAYFGVDYEPYTVQSVRRLSSPPAALPFNGAAIEAVAIIEAQRHTPLDGSYYVGGFAEMVTVGPRGATSEALRHWPDRIGARINPWAEGARHRRTPSSFPARS